ncbi:Alpha/Beta hydrolase protein [Hypoxylon argillaceum]|nr:Alpha/Beta hydrolase protein [Hypoxylon argillaceum]
MPRFWSIVRQKPARVVARTGLRTSAALPTSGTTSLDNSEGASQGLAELLDSLDTALAQLSLEDDPRAQLTAQLEQLDWKASSYVNSSLDFCISKEPWKCTTEMADLIMKSWLCAERVYGRDIAAPFEEAEDSCLNVQWSLPSSTNGNVKATTLTTFVAPPPYDSYAKPTTYLIIAVRGSASTVDQLINLHGEPRDADTLFQDFDKSHSLGPTLNFQAHAGFLNSAQKLLAPVSAQIEKHLSKGQDFKIVLTGHSAGGAVATLLHIALTIKFTSVSFSCITFGSPPVAAVVAEEDRIAINRILAQAPVLNIVNEYDLVPRLDRGYLRSLIRLFNSEALIFNGEESYTTKDDSTRRWPLPASDLKHVGPIVVLRTELPDLRLDNIKPSDVSTRVTAWSVTSEDISSLVFCKLQVHKRKYYREKIDQLVSGNFEDITSVTK